MRASRRDIEGSSKFPRLLRTVTLSALETSALSLLHSRISMQLTNIQRHQVGTITYSHFREDSSMKDETTQGAPREGEKGQ